MPQSEQNRSSASRSSPQSGQTSGAPWSSLDGDVLFLHAPVRDPPGAHARLPRKRHDHVAPVRVVGEGDVGLRRLRRALRVRVVDHDLVALVVELVRRQQAARVDLIAVRRRAQVLGAEDLLHAAVAGAGVAAALVGGVVARMRDQLVPVRLRDDHRIKAIDASRRQLVGGSLALAAGALVASCGGGSDSKPQQVPTVSTTEAESDAAVLGALLDQEYSSIAAYELPAGKLHGASLASARRFAAQERRHADALARASRRRRAAPSPPRPQSEYASGFPRLRGERDALSFALDVETT